ncbi:sialate O-acetylesterase-like [Ruditapes philippinarum]|uniref:sialate O-acetylesterase-like n=1 Tax=Ruditapes philippinarum TaxID=129788 RepID=UPI00295B4683|nr:sialate O-acetylesterase-like [Ruditapes philippinarum]
MFLQIFVFFVLFESQNVYGAGTLRFSHYFHSHMVLQMEPAKAQLWGYATTIGDTVNIKLNGTAAGSAVVNKRTDGHAGGVWSALLPAHKAGGPVTISITSQDGHAALFDVLFGDVWICSGQSNMAFSLKDVFNHSVELEHTSHFNNIRIMKVNLRSSNTTMEEPVIALPWRKPIADKYTGLFSAVCLLYAVELAPHINRPIGLVQTAWGGTPIESWSSPGALSTCSHRMKRGPHQHSVLWNAMVYPLLRATIYGAIWYQGEANSRAPEAYACQFPAMIDDWRSKFNAASQLQTDKQFPFGFVQLAANSNITLHAGFPDIRWSQTAKYGYVPNPRLPNVFMAVAMDLPDYNSTRGTIHPRDKQDVAKRLALAGRAVAYKETNLDFQGPIPTSITQMTNKLVIEFDHGNSAIEVRATDGFELCCGNNIHHNCSYNAWKPAPIVAHDLSTVTINTAACHGSLHVVAAVRYAWEMSPCEFKMCPLYDSTNDLPAATFVKYAPFNSQ